ncbi:MAG TPA: aminoglycoside phosphotransferase family protein [Longimicrobium sp.]|nr:aminoglycoside phosphotransferase family protein [Longimicrobium sp.]
MARKLEWTVQGLLPEAVVEPVITAISAGAPGRWPVSITTFAQDSNDRAEVRFDDGRTLVVKRARHEWARGRFAVSRAAAGLLREAGIPAPRPLAVAVPDDGLPVEAYWKVELPTLAEVWTGAGRSGRGALLREWGRLVRRIHRIRLPRHGPLLRPHPGGLGGHLREDLERRLLPAVACTWPEAGPLVEALAGAAERIAGRLAGAPAVLVHNDLHSGNVLCSADGAGCAGVLDLEAAFAGPPEADIAHADVLHGPLFGKPLPAGWLDELLRGYGRALDPVVLAYFRAFHLANLGYHAALSGYGEHAAGIRAAMEGEVRALSRAVPSGPPAPPSTLRAAA